jgi:hypothetical protein
VARIAEAEWDYAIGWKPSANILDMKYQRWQATGCGADQERANAL